MVRSMSEIPEITITPGQLLRIAVHELAGVQCRCGRPKQPRQTFCRKCYYTLPRPQQRELYQRVGCGYEAAYIAAVNFLAHAGRMERPEWLKV
jgi:hypothetical protein